MDIQGLTKRYRDEDPQWSIEGLLKWLRDKKQIPEDIAEYSLKLGLIDLENGVDIPTHHTETGFDNYILNIAREFMIEQERIKIQKMEAEIENKIKMIRLAKPSGNRFVRAFKVLAGKL